MLLTGVLLLISHFVIPLYTSVYEIREAVKRLYNKIKDHVYKLCTSLDAENTTVTVVL